MVHAGRIYETEGANAVGVHLAEAIRPLCPIPHAPSIRFFDSRLQVDELDDPIYVAGNASSIFGPSQTVELPEHIDSFDVEPYLVAISASEFQRADEDLLEEVILGYTVMLQIVDRVAGRISQKAGAGYGNSRDLGGALGPLVTTPDEMEEFLVDDKISLEVVFRVNGVDKLRSNLSDLPFSGKHALGSASRSGLVRVGDLFALGPLVDLSELEVPLKRGDDVQVAIQSLGTLSISIS